MLYITENKNQIIVVYLFIIYYLYYEMCITLNMDIETNYKLFI